MDTAHTRTLQRALEVLGNMSRLAAALQISLIELDVYLRGEKRLPETAYLKALDIVAHSPRNR